MACTSKPHHSLSVALTRTSTSNHSAATATSASALTSIGVRTQQGICVVLCHCGRVAQRRACSRRLRVSRAGGLRFSVEALEHSASGAAYAASRHG